MSEFYYPPMKNYKGNLPPKELLLDKDSMVYKKLTHNKTYKGVKLFDKGDGLCCEGCGLYRGSETINPFDYEIRGVTNPCVLCLECKQDIAEQI